MQVTYTLTEQQLDLLRLMSGDRYMSARDAFNDFVIGAFGDLYDQLKAMDMIVPAEDVVLLERRINDVKHRIFASDGRVIDLAKLQLVADDFREYVELDSGIRQAKSLAREAQTAREAAGW